MASKKEWNGLSTRRFGRSSKIAPPNPRDALFSTCNRISGSAEFALWNGHRRLTIHSNAELLVSPFAVVAGPMNSAKFRDPHITANGDRRAAVTMDRLDSLWINTGTLCNLSCANCYIESSPTNDALVYLSLAEAEVFLAQAHSVGTREIGFTGGEPFMNRDTIHMIGRSLSLGFEVLVLTNAMRPMRRFERQLLALVHEHGTELTMRVSLDHHTKAVHEAERGLGTWEKALDGLKWLSEHGFNVAVAGRSVPGESQADANAGFSDLFDRLGVSIDAGLVIFPEMNASADVPEISEACWSILGVSPRAMMCSSSRMVVKRKGAERPVVVACTLLPYDPQFELGETLVDADPTVMLNHPHCARFCVLGGASCSG